MNQVNLHGRLTRDPELRYLPSGSAVVQSSIALNRRHKDQASGEMKETTTFVNFKAYGKQGEVIAQYLKKGDSLVLSGRLHDDSYEKDGKKVSHMIVIVEEFDFVGGGKKEERAPAPRAMAPPTTRASSHDLPTSTDDDIPFHHLPPEIIARHFTGTSIHRFA